MSQDLRVLAIFVMVFFTKRYNFKIKIISFKIFLLFSKKSLTFAPFIWEKFPFDR